MTFTCTRSNDYLEHHGIKGQKWGVRRFQNTDGSLTSAGKKRYDVETSNNSKEKKTSSIEQNRTSPKTATGQKKTKKLSKSSVETAKKTVKKHKRRKVEDIELPRSSLQTAANLVHRAQTIDFYSNIAADFLTGALFG